MENDNQNQPIQLQTIPPIPRKKWYQHKGLIIIVVLAFLLAIFAWIYFANLPAQNVSPIVVPHKITRAQLPTATSINVTQPAAITSAAAGTSTAASQTLILNSSLVMIPDQKLFICKQSGCSQMTLTYYDTDITIASGLYAGDKVMLLDCGCIDGEGETDSFFRFVNTGTGNILLQKYSVDLSSFMQNYDYVFTQGQFTVDDKTDVPALDPYMEISDPKSGAVLKLSLSSLDTGAFFNHDGRKPFFTDNYNEPVYLAEPLFNGSAPDSESFEVEAPDGTDLWYELDDPFLPNADGGFTSTLNITWNDGQSHNNKYQYDPSNNTDGGFNTCEEGVDFVNAVTTNPVSQNQLTEVGSSGSGQPIYGYANINNPVTQAAVAEIQAAGNKLHSDPADIVIFWKDPFGRLIRFVSSDMLQACGGKPVIYLYPTKPTNISVQIKPAGGISNSIPTYNNGWNVLAQPNGVLTENGQQYPYLFWEGGLGSYQMPSEGFVVSKFAVKGLLDTKLSFIGLNVKEISDFEQFWLPKMQTSPYYFVTFTTNSEMEKYAPLTIVPKPDTTIRVMMDYKPLQNYERVMPLNLQSTKREGFTVIEWGGALK